MNTTNSLLHNLGKRIKRVMVGKVGVVEGGGKQRAVGMEVGEVTRGEGVDAMKEQAGYVGYEGQKFFMKPPE